VYESRPLTCVFEIRSRAAVTLPYATLLAFTRYVDRTGPAKATFVCGLRRQRESGGGFNPHGQLIKALKTDIDLRTGGTYLTKVTDTVSPHWRKLYGTLSEGATAYLGTLGDPAEVRLTPTHDAIAIVGDLPVRVAAHYGLRYDDGHNEAVRLYFDEQPPTPEVVTATLHLMSAYMEQVLPHAEPVLVDVRRGLSYRVQPMRGTPDDIERWLAGEAAGFSAIWRNPA
jgi:hypothetical protein